MTEPILRPPSARFNLRRIVILVVALGILAITPVVVYYYMSYSSVNGTVVQIASVRRAYSPPSSGFFSSSPASIVYYVEAHIWSNGASMDTHVSNPSFTLVADSIGLGTVNQYTTESFQPYHFLVYTFQFSSSGGTAQALGEASSNSLSLTMNALVNAGNYQDQLTRLDSRTLTWS